MITIKAKYNEHKNQVVTDRKLQKSCTLEAIAIITELYDLIIKNTPTMSEKEIQQLLKDNYKMNKKEEEK